VTQIKALQAGLAERAGDLLLDLDEEERDEAMAMLEDRLDSYGLVNPPGYPRREDPEEFARDLFRDNPLIHDWLNLNRERITISQLNNRETVWDLLDLL